MNYNWLLLLQLLLNPPAHLGVRTGNGYSAKRRGNTEERHLVESGVMKINCRRCCRSDSSSRRFRETLRLCMSCAWQRSVSRSISNTFKHKRVRVCPLTRFCVCVCVCFHHVDVELVEASERRFGDLPQRQHEANGGEGALATGQRPHVAYLVVLAPRRIHLYEEVWALLCVLFQNIPVWKGLKPVFLC